MKRTTKYALSLALAVGTIGSANAVVIDLTNDNGGTQTCAAINMGWVCNRTGNAGSVGSGTFPSFVATPGGQDPAFSFYNTEGAIEPSNAVGNGNGDNETLQIGQLGVDSFMGTNVVTFALDINQINSGEPQRLLTLDHIALFDSVLGDLSGYVGGTPDTLGGAPSLWQLGDFSIDLNYDLAFGSGNDIDMYLLLDTSIFGGKGPATYLQLFSSFGHPLGGAYPNNDGFEEWAYKRCATTDQGCIPTERTTPEPGLLTLLGIGMLGLGVARRRLAA